MAFDPFEEKAPRAILPKICKGTSLTKMKKLFDTVATSKMTVDNLNPGGVSHKQGDECLALAEVVAAGRGNGGRNVTLPVDVEKWLAEKSPDFDDDLAVAAKAAVDKVRKNSGSSAIVEEMGGWPEWTSYCRGLSSRLGKSAKQVKPTKQRKATPTQKSKVDPLRILRDAGCRIELEGGEAIELRAFNEGTITVEELKLIVGLKKLRFLLLNQAIGDKDLGLLSSMKQLRELVINSQDLKGTGFRDINLPRLQRLSIPRKHADTVVANCTHLQGLKKFDLRSTDLSDKGFQLLAELPALNSLDLDHCKRIKGTGFKHFHNGSKLAEVSAYDVGFSGPGWQALLDVKGLRKLSVSSAKIPRGGMERLAECKQLQTLQLGHHKLTDDDVEFLTRFKRLKVLSLNGNKGITDRTVEMLASLPALEEIDLSYTSITKKSEATLSSMPKLHNVSVYFTGMTRAAEKRLEKLCESRELAGRFVAEFRPQQSEILRIRLRENEDALAPSARRLNPPP